MKRDENKLIIWQNIDIDYEDWRDDLEDYYPDEDGYDEQERIEKMHDINEDYLDDERVNLNINIHTPIIYFGTFGAWDGPRCGWSYLDSTNIRDCLRDPDDCCAYMEFYVDKTDGDLKFTGIHHDGRNYYTFRAFKPGMTDDEIEQFEIDFMERKLKMEDIYKYTIGLGDYVADVYGWNKTWKEEVA